MLGKDLKLRAFQNICRHRAYRVTKEHGSSAVLGCRYHGWAYDTRGKLIKAPEFDNVPGFDKSKNGLWEVGIQVLYGFVYVKLDSDAGSKAPAITTTPVRLLNWNRTELHCAADWRFEAKCNWKLAGMLQ
jgi:phenylpropionate dioxygenase-like ring-hydroxylating dioxygenase large terminal subunit